MVRFSTLMVDIVLSEQREVGKMRSIFAAIRQAIVKLRNYYFRSRSHYVKYYDELPIDERCVLLESQHGTEVNGNIFYIIQYLASQSDFNDWKLYVPSWIRHRKKIEKILATYHIKNIRVVTYASDEYFRILASAKYLINDNTFDPAFIKKEGQVYLNTWHGTPLKALGRRMSSGSCEIGNAQKNFIVCDYILFPNQHTRDALIRDYMVDNLSNTAEIFAGYPRNAVFFNEARRSELREQYDSEGKRLYAFMPTFRGTPASGGTDKNDIYLKFFLYELDKHLTDDELLYLNLHPVAKKNVSFRQFKHIKPFPAGIETYDFLNIVDCLITDYSSVFFDFANTRNKIILFPYDREEYFVNRGTYINIDDLPFPIAYDIPTLLSELRTEKNYDDSAFLAAYCPYENQRATEQLCDFLFRDNRTELKYERNKSNGRDNILIYVGNLAGNGITRSIQNLLSAIDLNERNYYLTFKAKSVSKFQSTLNTFSEQVNYISMIGDMNVTITERVIRKLFKYKWISARLYTKLMGKRIRLEWMRCFGDAHFDTAIQFNGYEAEIIMMWSQFPRNKVIYVHSDMIQEIKTRGNQRLDVLRYAYQTFDKVALVTEDMRPSAFKIARSNQNFYIAHNLIDFASVRAKSRLPLEIVPHVTQVYPCAEQLELFLASDLQKFITIGRFSPEKGHFRLLDAFAKVAEKYSDVCLIIIGGVSNMNYYELTQRRISELRLENHVVLIKNLPNPFPILASCDYFVLSSLYEGFGLVLAEADILGKPVVSTDIRGPRTFMQAHGGKLVEDSLDGIYHGMLDLLNGQVKTMDVDYEAYNRKALQEFESLLQ